MRWSILKLPITYLHGVNQPHLLPDSKVLETTVTLLSLQLYVTSLPQISRPNFPLQSCADDALKSGGVHEKVLEKRTWHNTVQSKSLASFWSVLWENKIEQQQQKQNEYRQINNYNSITRNFMFSSSTACKLPMSDSSKRQSDYFGVRSRSLEKRFKETDSVMARWKALTCTLSCSQHIWERKVLHKLRHLAAHVEA